MDRRPKQRKGILIPGLILTIFLLLRKKESRRRSRWRMWKWFDFSANVTFFHVLSDQIKKEEMELASDSDFDDAPLVSNPVTKKRKREASDSDSDFDDVPLVEKKIKKVEKKPKKPKKEKKPQKINKAKPQKRKAEQKTSNSSKRAKKEDDGLSVEERREKKRLEKLQVLFSLCVRFCALMSVGMNWCVLQSVIYMRVAVSCQYFWRLLPACVP